MTTKNIQETLEQFGLSEAEARIYHSVLALEGAPVDKIARRADTNRTSTYPVLERLEKMGLVSRLKKKGKTVYRAAAPEKFLDILEDKKEKIEKVLPDLKSLFAIQEGRPNVQLFEGVEGLKTVLNMILNEATTEVLIFSDGESFLKKIPGWAEAYVLKRSRKNVRVRMVLKSSVYNIQARKLLREGKTEKAKTNKIRLLPEAYEIEDSGFDIYNNKVVFYSFDKQNVAVVVESKIVSRLMRTNFEILWNEAGRYDDVIR
jgi:HTH-type transcriptional regulator, sugar sensing transcriptional regulator